MNAGTTGFPDSSPVCHNDQMTESIPQPASPAVPPVRKRSTTAIVLWSIVAVVAVLGAWLLSLHMSYRHQMEAIAHVERLGGSVGTRYEGPEWIERLQPGVFLFGPDPLGPNWLRERLPADDVVRHFLVVDAIWLDQGPGQRIASNVSGEYQEMDAIVITDDDLRMISRFGKLEQLYLRKMKIGDAGLGHLRNLTEIRTISLSFTDITDAGMETIARFEKLETLRLVGTRVTDSGLARLTGLKHLKQLDVRQTKVTEVGLEPFRAKPDLRVVVDEPGLQLLIYY